MLKKIHINEMERGFVYDGQNLVNYLKPGKYRLWMKSGMSVETLDITQDVHMKEAKLRYLYEQEAFRAETVCLEVQDGQAVLHKVNGRAEGILTSGFYLFWNVKDKNEFTVYDMEQVEITDDLSTFLRFAAYRPDLFFLRVVESWEKGICYIDNKMHKLLEPGRYLFWNEGQRVKIQTVDLRMKTLELSGQEILTADKVPLRVNFTCQYKVLDPERVLETFKNHEEQLYGFLQLVLRELIGTLTFDELMSQKHALGEIVLEKVAKEADYYAVSIQSAGIKDIILPGDIRDIMNTVLLAEKRAAANVITRREETASTRSLLNTAKLMEENKTLYRLKELEYIERICDRIGNVSLSGQQGLLEQLQMVVAGR